ncbi:MAG: hypothetical protein QXD13_01735 [Candidatus Pacearchaeota archaeon]
MHKKQTALKVILIIALAGVLFSGYLSYVEMSAAVCVAGKCGMQIAGLPVCVYGLAMYLAVFVISWMGLRSRK